MAQFKLPKAPKDPPLYRLEPFKGIDLSGTQSQISQNHSPDMLNFNIDERGALNKRTGYERVFQTSLGTGKINGLFYYKDVFLLAHGTQLYTQTGEAQPVSIYTGLANNDVTFFVMRDKNGQDVCYIMDGTNYLVYNGTSVSQIDPYIPTLAIAKPPEGGGTPYEDFNLLGAGFKDSFSGDNTAMEYHLSLKGLDATTVKAEVDGVTKTEGTDFSVNRTTGIVTFTTAPPTGTDNVIITAYKTQSGFPERIKKCRFVTLFGGSNDTRIFVGGNPDFPNQVWRSGLYDGTYFPENGYYRVGDNTAVQGFVKQYDYLVIEKEKSKWSMQYEIADTGPSFPLKPINDQAGTTAPKSIQMIENNPISLDSKGVYLVTASNIRDERNIQHVSKNIDPKLLNEPNLEQAVSVDFDKKYWLALNNKVYVFDYQIAEWVIYDNIPVNQFYIVGDRLYFGSSTDGILYKFKKPTDVLPYNDDGAPINAYWVSKLINFESPEMLKLVKHIYHSMKTDPHTSSNVYLRTDKKGERFISTKRIDKIDFFNFDFMKFGFITSDIPQELSKKIKEKKITHLQLKIENKELDESLGITSLGLAYNYQRMVK